MTDLIKRLEEAEAGSRELSDAVLLACGWRIRPDVHIVWDDPTGYGIPDDRRPSPTESLDDALALKPEGWFGNVTFGDSQEGPGEDLATMWNGQYAPHSRETEGKAATPALALCIAILKAREAETP